MIPSLKDEIRIIFYLISYGIFIITMYDLFLLAYQKKKVVRHILEIMFWLVMIYLTYQFSYHLHDGYIPIYFAFFLLIGGLIYIKWLKKPMIEGANMIKILCQKLKKPLKKLIIFLFYSKEGWYIIKYPFVKMKETTKLLYKTIKKNKNNEEETINE